MRRWHGILLILPFVLLGVALTITRMIRAADPRPAAKVRMMVTAYENLRTDYFVQNYVLFHWISQAVTIEEESDRLPSWAGSGSRCYRWEADFHVRNRLTQNAVAEGRYQGWCVVGPDKAVRILELRRIDDLSGETVTLIDAWDGPSQDDGT